MFKAERLLAEASYVETREDASMQSSAAAAAPSYATLASTTAVKLAGPSKSLP